MEQEKERIIDRILNLEVKFRNIKLKLVDICFIACIFLLSFAVRWSLMPIESPDYWGFLEVWMNQIREGGGYRSLGQQISNYTSPYMYIMCFLSYFKFSDLYMLKLVSILFDYIAGFAMFGIVHQISGSIRKATVGMSILLLSPAVIIDSAYWCQCDIIYTTFLLIALYFFFKDKSRMALLFVAISFSFKLQALFIVPFFIIMWLKKKTIKIRDFLLLPIVYVISAFPAWMMGRDFKDLMTIYTSQADYYPWGTLEYPNIYTLLGEAMPDMRHAYEVADAGMFMTIAILGCLAYYLYTKRVYLTKELMITLALFSVSLIVYSLPHMHDRYGFLIDLLAIVYGVTNVKKLPVTAGFTLVSVVTFMPYLIGIDIVPIQYVAIALFGLIVYVGRDLYQQIQSNIIPAPQIEEPVDLDITDEEPLEELENENPVLEPAQMQSPLAINRQTGNDGEE